MRRCWTILLGGLSSAALAQAAPLPAPAAVDRAVLPIAPQPFRGVANPTYRDSRPFYPPQVTAPAGAPNILLIMTDDVGFGAASTFGGPVPTPNLDRLAARGLRYTRFHTTAMCSPTRAALLTGRNHHAVGSGIVTDTASGYPGYDGSIPRSAATIAEILRDNGYSTALVGKHHNVPSREQSPAGPFDHWPTGLGFDHFYGFVGGDANQWQPVLYRGTEPVSDQPPPGQTLDRLLVDDAIHWVHTQKAAAPDKPFFLYLAPGSAHAPHQAPPEWIARFRGQFGGGWDELRAATLRRQIAGGIAPPGTRLTPRPTEIPAWSSLSPEEQQSDAHMMEVFAGMLAYQDHQIGRLLDELGRMGLSDDTLVMFIEGDNGGSPEGGLLGTLNEIGTLANGVQETPASKHAMLDRMGSPDTFELYPVGWAWATNSPFQWTKQVGSHLGGTRNGLVVSWPEHIHDAGGIRTEFGHVVDVAPTLLEAAGLPMPRVVDGAAQQPLDGVSLAYTFDRDVPEKPRTQYFELLGNRAIYKDGWMASTTPARMPWKFGGSGISPLDYRWELYDLRHDYSQAVDLAAKEPGRLADLKALWTKEAERNQVFPLDDRQGDRSNGVPPAKPRTHFEYWGGGISVNQPVAPMLGVRSFSMDADVVIPAQGADGALVATGSRFGGWSFYFENGRPVVAHAASIQQGGQYRIAATAPIPAGPAHMHYEFASRGPGAGGRLTISVDGRQVAAGDIGKTAIIMASIGEPFDTGRDTGAPVVDYPNGSRFTGSISRIVVDLK